MERKNIIFDSQILNSVQMCAYRTDLMFNQNLQPPIKATPLEEGDLLHRMFEFYNLRQIEALSKGTNILYEEELFKQLLQEAEEYGERASVELEISGEEVSSVIYQFKEYCIHTRMSGVTPLEVEKPFITEVFKDEEIGIFYTGKIDRLGTFPNFGLCWGDYKSARRTQEPSPISNQFTGYSFATGLRTGIISKVGFQKTLTPEARFREYPLFYTEEQIERWRQDTIFWGRMYAFYIENGTWPRNRTSCDKYGGCIFLRICESATEEALEWIKKAEFIVGEKWDVTKYLKKDKKDGEVITV